MWCPTPYIKSPTAELHKGFSAGSYKDMTRVAWLAPEMWAELFLENKDFLMAELDTLMANLRQYQDAWYITISPALSVCWTRAGNEKRRWMAVDHHPYRGLPRV